MSRLLFVLLCIGMCQARLSKDLEVGIDDGRIIGRYLTSETGRTIRAFMGIPYAEPPVGDLRFRPPVKVKRWEGTLLAQKEPPMCVQKDPLTRSTVMEGQEDCLYLNVYAPEKRNATIPVMVFIHGGGYQGGHGGYSQYAPEYLLDHEVILVTGNYRLGPLGFLSFEDKECPGNFGLKDQVEILKWVKKNIDKFGGDSNSITIFGESVGSASVSYHMISPMSKGLFNRAISQSGSFMDCYANTHRPGLAQSRAQKMAKLMNCTNDNLKDTVECLRKADAMKITDAIKDFYEWDYDPVIPFPPVVEDFLAREDQAEAFLPNYRLIKDSYNIPWMVGITSEEGLLRTSAFLNNKELMDDMKRNWDRLLPIVFYYNHLKEEDQKNISRQISEFYFNNKPFLDSSRDNLTMLWGDGFFFGSFENLETRLRIPRANTFVYLLSHKGSVSFSEVFLGGAENFYGTSHADDLIYLFPSHKLVKEFYSSIPTKEEKQVIRMMTKLWVNFASTGNPTPKKSFEIPRWTPASKFPLDYLVIGNKNGKSKKLLSMENGFYDERYKFWKQLKKQYPKWNPAKYKNEL